MLTINRENKSNSDIILQYRLSENNKYAIYYNLYEYEDEFGHDDINNKDDLVMYVNMLNKYQIRTEKNDIELKFHTILIKKFEARDHQLTLKYVDANIRMKKELDEKFCKLELRFKRAYIVFNFIIVLIILISLDYKTKLIDVFHTFNDIFRSLDLTIWF